MVGSSPQHSALVLSVLWAAAAKDGAQAEPLALTLPVLLLHLLSVPRLTCDPFLHRSVTLEHPQVPVLG